MSQPADRHDQRANLRPLGLFATTSLVVGAVVGADVYVIATTGAQLLGPAVVVAWIAGGLMAIAISTAMAQCTLALPRVGGSYAYTRAAFGALPSFVVGWCFYSGELLTIAVFPLAFVRYLHALLPGIPEAWSAPLMLGFVIFVSITNYLGARAAGAINVALTIGKLLPLVAIIVLGVPWIALNPEQVAESVEPFAPNGWGSFGAALTLVFWAYAGFEIAPLPADEVRSPRKTLPRALGWGMISVTALYLLLNVVVIAVLPTRVLADSPTPLVNVASELFASFGLPPGAAVVVVAVGAILAISGVEESMTLGTSRLAHRLAVDGYLPRAFRTTSRRFGTPSVAIAFQGAATFLLALVGSIQGLVSIGVFYLSLVYLATSFAAGRLVTGRAEARISSPLRALVAPTAVIASAVLLVASAQAAGPLGIAGVLAVLAVGWYVVRRQT